MEYSYLLDKNQAEKLLNDNAEEIFGTSDSITVKNIKRSKTFNLEGSMNALYDLKVGVKELRVRVSASTFLDKEHDYNAMRYLHENGFDQGDFIVPRPMTYLEKEKILFYENVEGERLADILDLDEAEFERCIKDCAVLARKVHGLALPSASLLDPQMFFDNFDFGMVNHYFPKANNLETIIKKLKSRLSEPGQSLCHGDLNLNNIIVRENSMCLIDFGMTSIFHKEIDLASFVTSLRLLLEKDEPLFEKLKNVFLVSYGEFDQERYNLLMGLIDARLLELSIAHKGSKINTNFVFTCLKSDLVLAKINL